MQKEDKQEKPVSQDFFCGRCGLPLSEHKIAVGYYTLPDGSEKDYEGCVCPDLSEGDESDIAQEAHIKLESKGER